LVVNLIGLIPYMVTSHINAKFVMPTHIPQMVLWAFPQTAAARAHKGDIASNGTRTYEVYSMIPTAKAKLLEPKKGLVVGIANDQSIAWGGVRQGLSGAGGRGCGDLSQ
jgi:hypothetical protein